MDYIAIWEGHYRDKMKKKEGKGISLEKRVGALFRKAGFEIKPKDDDDNQEEVILKSGKKRTIDVVAFEKKLKVKIIISCKSGKKLPEPITTYVHDYKEIKKQSNADKVIFVITKKEVQKEDQNYIHEANMVLWTEQELKYYEIHANTVEEFAKYEIMDSLGITTAEEKDFRKFYAFKFCQPLYNSINELYAFFITPEELLKIGRVYRAASHEAEAYQRILRRDRLDKVGEFVNKETSLLPTDIIISFGKDADFEPLDQKLFTFKEKDKKEVKPSVTRDILYIGILTLPMKYSSAEIIDGQHRIYGFIKAKEEHRKEYNLLVVGMKDPGYKKRKELFVTINSTAKPVNPNLVSFLKYEEDENECKKDTELMAIKTVIKLNEYKNGPFKDKIQLLDWPSKKISLRSYSVNLRNLIGPRGVLREFCEKNKNYEGNTSKDYIKILNLYFSTIKGLFKKEWMNPEKYILANNRAINAFLKLIKPILSELEKKKESELTYEFFKKYLSSLKKFDWKKDTFKNTYLGVGGQKKFYEDLLEEIRKKYPNFAKI